MRTCGRMVLWTLLLGAPLRGSAMSDDETAEKAALETLLPAAFDGWQKTGEDRIFDPQTIFDYIDGSGEVYRAYNLAALLARRYGKAGQPPITIDLFDMGSPANAFGVFTHDLDGEDAGTGQGSRYNGGLLQFWKGRYFVSVCADKETEHSRRAVLAAGKAIAESIRETGPLPALVDLLPPGTHQEALRYFHTHEILNYHFFVSEQNLLALGPHTEAVLADLGDGTGSARLLMVKYPRPEEARRALAAFVAGYMPDAVNGIQANPGNWTGNADLAKLIDSARLVKTENGKWTAAASASDCVVIVFDASSAGAAAENVAHVLENFHRREK